MTIDKETLIKHRFWISLGVFVLLWLVGVILIPTVQGSNNAGLEKKFDSSKKGVEGINDPKTEKFQEPLKQKEAELKKQKDKVWAQAWEPQANFMAWPEGGTAQLSGKLSKAYFGDWIRLDDRSEYGSSLYKKYLDSLQLSEMVKPVEFDNGWRNVIHPVSGWDPDRPPTVEECWLAQEDLWVKRELLSIIQETLDSVRIFKEYKPPLGASKDAKETKKEEPAPGGAKSQLMRNANWELNLIVEPGPNNGGMVISAKSTFKNINPWKRWLSLADVHFRVHQGGDSFLPFTVPVDRVAGDETADFKQAIPFGKFDAKLSKPLQVEQMLSWQTSPIKRIDKLELGYNSHRTANRTCKAKQIGKPGEDENKDKQDAPTGTTPGGPGSSLGGSGSGPPPGMMTSSPILGASGAPGAAGGKGINADLNRERYLDFTEQVRWMPVGIVLIVDQQYMQDVQVAVANSRLRLQPTQIAYHRAYNIRSAPSTGTSTSPDRKERPVSPVVGEGVPGGGSGRYGSSSPMPPGAGGSRGGKFGSLMPPGGPSPYNPAGGTASSTGNEDDPNVVELSIYAIASLYERFPPKQPAAPASPKP